MSILNAQIQANSDARNLTRINEQLGHSLNRLSSGSRIAKPSEDPVGVSSVAKLDAQHLRVQAASINVQNGASYVQSAIGFMDSMGKLLSRMSELSQFAGDGLKSAEELSLYQTEFVQLQEQMRLTIGGTTAEIGGTYDIDEPLGRFNRNILFGPNPAGLSIASGANPGDTIVIPQTNLRLGSMRDLIQQDASGNFLLEVTDPGITAKTTAAMTQMADERSVLAGVGARLEFAAHSLTVQSQNLSSAISRIEDLDIAKESTRLSKLNILLESGTAMITQANQSPRSVLKLLQV